jgi:hypothetical protein
MKFKVTCRYEDGKFINKEVRMAIAEALKKCEGKLVTFSLVEWKPLRSKKQNSFYWGFILPPVAQLFTTGGEPTTPEEAHEYLMVEVGKLVYISALTGKQRRLSSTKLTRPQWEDYITQIRAWGAEYGLSLPFPNEAQWSTICEDI